MRSRSCVSSACSSTDGRAGDGGTGVRGLEMGRATGALVEAVEREVLVVAATHGRLQALDRGSLVAQSVGLAGGDLGAVELVLGRGVDEEQLGGFSRARERGVGPVAGEVLRTSDHARPLNGGALDGVRGQHVGVLEMLGHIGSIEAALGAGVGAHEHVFLGRVDGDHRPAHAVIDRPLPIVAPRDDPIAHGELAATDLDALAQPSVALQLGADERVEALAAVVVTDDQDSLPPRAGGLAVAPRGDRCVLAARPGASPA